jgi:hypothetical protein
LAVSLLFCLLVGAVLDQSLLCRPGRGAIEHLGRSLALGLGTVGALSMLVDGLGAGVSIYTVVGSSLVLMLILAPGLLRKKTEPSSAGARPPSPFSLLHSALLLMAFAALGFMVYTGWLRPCYQYDALVRWMFKAKALAVDGTLLGPLSTDASFHYTHQRYPPLISHVANLPHLVTGQFNDRVASALFPWYAVALVFWIYGALRRTIGRMQASIAAAWIASLPLIAFRDGLPPIGVPPGSGAFSALADIPLALFATGAALAALDGMEGRRGRAFLESGLLLAFAALTKNEGLPFVAAAVLGVLLCAAGKRWRAALLMALVALVLYGLLWGRIALTLPALDENYPAQLNMQALSEGLKRLPFILARMLEEIVFLPSWNLTWFCFFGLLILSGRAALDRGGRLLLIIILFQVGVYILAFMITAWTSPAVQIANRSGGSVGYLMDTSLGRLFLHVVPLCIVAALRAAPLLRARSGAVSRDGGEKVGVRVS